MIFKTYLVDELTNKVAFTGTMLHIITIDNREYSGILTNLNIDSSYTSNTLSLRISDNKEISLRLSEITCINILDSISESELYNKLGVDLF